MPIPLPKNTQSYQVNPNNYIVGRGSCPDPLAVVLHGQPFDPGEIIAGMCRDESAFHSPHTSFHYVVKPNANWVAQFVKEEDTAIAISNETPPVLPTGCTGSTPDQKTINVLVDWPLLIPNQTCPPDVKENTALLCSLLASVFANNGITPGVDTLLIATKELPGLDVAALIQCVKNTIATPPASVDDRACLPPHLTTQDMASPLAVWDGNCLREATKLGTDQYCDYSVGVSAVDDVKLLSVTLGNKTYIAPNGGIAMNDVLAIRAWLNSLTSAPASWNVAYGFTGNDAQLVVQLLTSNKVLSAMVFSNATITPAESNCVDLPAQVPITLNDVTPPVITYEHGVFKVNGVVLVTGVLSTNSNGNHLGYLLPL